jgi:hypothetical protein
MDVICDTNIWYGIGAGYIKFKKEEDLNLWGTHLSIDELSKSEKLLNPLLRDFVRKAIQEMIKNKNVIYEHPFFSLLVESKKGYKYDIKEKDGKLLGFTQLIANHHDIDEGSNKGKFKDYVTDRKARIQAGTDFFSGLISDYKDSLKKTSSSIKENNPVVIREFIKLIVKSVTKEDLSDDFDWSRIELFEKTLDYYFSKLENSEMKIKNNDWLDLAFLVYVRPEQKIWTKDKRLKALIKECGLSDYLYEK